MRIDIRQHCTKTRRPEGYYAPACGRSGAAMLHCVGTTIAAVRRVTDMILAFASDHEKAVRMRAGIEPPGMSSPLGTIKMGKLTTHVLDTHSGVPAANIRIELYSIGPGGPRMLSSQVTGSDGRLTTPLLEGEALQRAQYEIVFGVADYFSSRGVNLPDPPFIAEARIKVGIAFPDQHYHVPLLITPWSYSVYRGG